MTGTRQKQILVAILFLVVASFIGWNIRQTIEHRSDGILQLKIAPSDSKATANGKKVGTGKNYLKPGSYVVKVTKQDFGTKERTVTIIKGKSASLGITLQPT